MLLPSIKIKEQYLKTKYLDYESMNQQILLFQDVKIRIEIQRMLKDKNRNEIITKSCKETWHYQKVKLMYL